MDIWSPRLRGARFLDLYAGSGVVGIEAVSRGAASLVSMESDPQVLLQLTENCRALVPEAAQTQSARLPEDLSRHLSLLAGDFDLIFADPPYAFDAYAELVPAAARLLERTGEMAVEHESRRELPRGCGGILLVDQRRYGDTCLSFFQREVDAQDCRKKASSSR